MTGLPPKIYALPFELLVALAILLGFANTYLILITALGYTWSRILRDIRQVSN
jgi:hypothetical protein